MGRPDPSQLRDRNLVLRALALALACCLRVWATSLQLSGQTVSSLLLVLSHRLGLQGHRHSKGRGLTARSLDPAGLRAPGWHCPWAVQVLSSRWVDLAGESGPSWAKVLFSTSLSPQGQMPHLSLLAPNSPPVHYPVGPQVGAPLPLLPRSPSPSRAAP